MKFDQYISKCEPSAEFDDCFKVSMVIKAPPEELYTFIADIENLTEAFPNIQFKRNTSGPLTVGSIYQSKPIKWKKWSDYKIIALEKNKRVSGELIGTYLVFKEFRYDHRLIKVEEGTLSEEKVEYSLRFGILGKILNAIFVRKLLQKIDVQAVNKLKEKVEK